MELTPLAKFSGVDHDLDEFTRDQRQAHCAGCNEPLGDTWIRNSLGGEWHPLCFLCNGCQKPIAERQFQVHGRDPYHKPCYQKKFDPVCEVCHDYIPINERSGMIEWRFHPFWGTKYCPAHEADQTSRCGSCERMQPRDQRYTDLNDGRKICAQCFDSVITDPKDCERVYGSIRDFYARLGLTIEQEIPVLLVDTKALKAAAEKDGHHRFEPDARGMCISEERIIETMHRGSSTSIPGTGRGHFSPLRHDISRPLTRKCVVTGIQVLFGFPRLLTGSIVTHEMMHAWLKLKGPFPIMTSTERSQMEEGICQFMAYLWLQTEVDLLASNSSLKGQIERRLGECFMHQIEKHDSPVYGDGFRAARVAVANYGLPTILRRIKTTGIVHSFRAFLELTTPASWWFVKGYPQSVPSHPPLHLQATTQPRCRLCRPGVAGSQAYFCRVKADEVVDIEIWRSWQIDG